ncbi:hypothetical protein BH09VER1_BH09VER1_51080 [soil metagenome]
MSSLFHDTLARTIVWGGFACLLIGLGLCLYGFLVKSSAKALLAFVLGGLFLTHFTWVFRHLESSAQMSASAPLWSSSLPIGLGIALGLGFLSSLFRKEYTGGIF